MASSLDEVEPGNLGSLGVMMDEVISNMAGSWDPSSSSDWDKEKPSKQCILRIKRDIMSIYNEPPPCMCIVPDKDDITRIHALITGPFDTPYEGGFFYFLIRCPPDYPIRPPRVKLMTTGGGQVRFNPNLYKNGKVCLSILGTWSGPAWSPAQSLSSVLISIQSLMNEKPYHNEPGFERERMAGDVKRYNDIIQHETVRIAVCDMLEGNCSCPSTLQEVMETSFSDYLEYYENVCNSNMKQQGQSMQDPFGEKRGNFDYIRILKRLDAIKIKLADKVRNSSDESSESEMDTSINESMEVEGKKADANSSVKKVESEQSSAAGQQDISIQKSLNCDAQISNSRDGENLLERTKLEQNGSNVDPKGTDVDQYGSNVDPLMYSDKSGSFAKR